MYNTIYYIIEKIKSKNMIDTDYSLYDNNLRFKENKIIEKLIYITVDYQNLKKYLSNEKKIYEVRKHNLDNYINLYTHNKLYIIFNTTFKKNKTYDKISIYELCYNLDETILKLKQFYKSSILIFDIQKINTKINEYPMTIINLKQTDDYYTNKIHTFQELKNYDKIEFLYLNNKKIKYPTESCLEFENRINKYKEYKIETKNIKEQNEKRRLEDVARKEKEIQEQIERNERIQKFLSLSIDQQKDLLSDCWNL